VKRKKKKAPLRIFRKKQKRSLHNVSSRDLIHRSIMMKKKSKAYRRILTELRRRRKQRKGRR
jgi:hypothetical protein